MIKITIYYGPSSKYEELVKEYKYNTLTLYEILKAIDNIRNTEEESANRVEIKNNYESIIIRSADYSSLSNSGENTLDQILMPFIKSFKIKSVFLQNPTKTIEKSIKLMVENKVEEFELDVQNNSYSKITEENIIEIYKNYSKNIIGQESVEKNILNMLYRLYKERNENKPLVIMFYGPSGVGKTETAKYISQVINEKDPFRSQMSMYQNNKSIDYLYGEEHNAKSLALDLLDRETNIVLLDEFDKANPLVYSTFYQMFDEGFFEDQNYKVYLNNTIIICTSNYINREKIKNQLGDPLYYRFDNFIKFQPINKNDVYKILNKVYQKEYTKLDDEEKQVIDNLELLERINSNINNSSNSNTYNYRQIKNAITEMIDSELVKNLINKLEMNNKS